MTMQTVVTGNESLYTELIRAAVLAPTPDNNQPWRFAFGDGSLRVYLDPSRELPSDVESMFDLIGLGAAIENACIAASRRGYRAVVRWASAGGGESPGKPRLVATIELTQGGDCDPLSSHLEKRCTCRKLYATTPIEAERLTRLARSASEDGNIQVDWLTERPQIGAFGRLIAASDRIRFEYQPFHEEVCRQLRFTAAEAERRRDGLDVRTLELPPGAGWLLRMLRPWNRMKWVHRLGLGVLLSAPSVLSVRRSGAIGLVSLAEPNWERFLGGGRAIERLWLAAEAEGLAMQPLGSLPIFLAHVEILGGRRLSDRHAARVRRLSEELRGLVPSLAGRTLLLAFRVGWSSAPSIRSLRRPLEEVLEGSLPEGEPR